MKSLGFGVLLCGALISSSYANDYSNNREQILSSLRHYEQACANVKFHKKATYQETQIHFDNLPPTS